MYCLSDEQIDYILDDIRRRGIEIEDLQFNLLDHICCILEQELKEGDDFERFYQQVVAQFYKKELSEIEEETIHLLTFKNYYAMKKLMIVSGVVSASVFIIGSAFKIMYWPGAGILLVLATLIFSLLFIPLVFLLKTKEANNQRDKWVLSIGTLVGIMYCFSTLFMLQMWPGARILWISTLAISFFVLVPMYFFSGIRKQETKVNTIVTTILLMGFLGMQFTMTAIRTSPQKLGRIYTYLQSQELLSEVNKKSVHTDANAQDIQRICEQLKTYILKYDMNIAAIPYNFEEQGTAIKEYNAEMLFMKDEGKQLLQQLRSKVEAYNAAHPGPGAIPITFSILDPSFLQRSFCSNLFVLNNIAQLQLYVASVDKSVIGN